MNGASDGSSDGLVIPVGAEVRGRIRARGDVRVEGRVEGDLEARRVDIAPGGEVIARITAARLDVRGAFIGVANATDTITVHAGATASGRLSAPRVEISPEALVDEATPRQDDGDDGRHDARHDARPREEQFEGAVTERLQLGTAALARLRAPTPTPTQPSAPAASPRAASPPLTPTRVDHRAVPAAPRPPTRARISLKPRSGG